MNVIEIRNLCKVYNGSEVQVTAVNGVNLDFQEGEFTAIVGPSGSGCACQLGRNLMFLCCIYTYELAFLGE